MGPQCALCAREGVWPTKRSGSTGILGPSAASKQKRTLLPFSNSEKMFSLWLGSRARLSPSPRQLLPSAKWHCSAPLVSLKWLGGLRGRAPLTPECWGSSVHTGGLRSCPWAPPVPQLGSSAVPAPPVVLTVIGPLCPLWPCLSPPLANKLLWKLMLLFL